VGTVSHPNNGALSASTGTFSGDVSVSGATTLSGNLGIGATTIDSDIHIEKSSDLEIKLERTGSGTSTIGVPSSGQLQINNTSNASMVFSTNNTEAMNISSGGIITKPLQPSIQFQGNNGTNESIAYQNAFGATDNSDTAFSTSTGTRAHARTGISYNTANGRFTVSTAGLYLAYFQAYYNDGASQDCRIAIYKNGVRQFLSHFEDLQYGTLHVNANLNCGANDYIYFQNETVTTRGWYVGPEHMGGYIIKVA